MAKGYYERDEPRDSFGKTIDFFNRNKKKILLWACLGLVGLVGACQSIYTVSADSQGVIRRFGAYNRTTEPGIHLKIPYSIEKVDKVPVRKVQKQEFGFRTIKAGIESKFVDSESKEISKEEREELKKEYLMLTGDLNMADVEFIVQYKIKEPSSYLFNIREPSKTIRDCSQDVIRKIIGDGSVDEAITIGRIENELQAKTKLQGILDDYQTGIHVVEVKLQSCHPLKRVRPSFNEVNEAMQQKEQRINEAMKEYNTIIPKAKGDAERMIKEAEGFAIERVNQARGDADKFLKILEEYSKAPETTAKRLHLEAMEKVLPQMTRKFLVEQKGAEGGLLLRLGLNEGGTEK